MIGASSVPEVVDPAVAEKEIELAVLSALAHGNGPNGAAVLEATETGLDRLAKVDREHAAAYFEMIYNLLRDPMKRVLEALVMQRQTENETTRAPFIQRFIDEGELKGLREGELKGLREGELKGLREGELKGLREGKLEGKRDALFRLIARAGVPLGEGDRARILACTDGATLDQVAGQRPRGEERRRHPLLTQLTPPAPSLGACRGRRSTRATRPSPTGARSQSKWALWASSFTPRSSAETPSPS